MVQLEGSAPAWTVGKTDRPHDERRARQRVAARLVSCPPTSSRSRPWRPQRHRPDLRAGHPQPRDDAVPRAARRADGRDPDGPVRRRGSRTPPPCRRASRRPWRAWRRSPGWSSRRRCRTPRPSSRTSRSSKPTGRPGMAVLERLRTMVPDDVPFVADAKRGDIGSTAAKQAVALYDVLGADAVTVNPYLGEEAIAPLLERGDRFAYVLCRTSNPGGGELQGLEIAADPVAGHPAEPLWARVARLAAAWGPGGTVGLVVGATAPSEMLAIRALAPGPRVPRPGRRCPGRRDGARCSRTVPPRPLRQAAGPAADCSSTCRGASLERRWTASPGGRPHRSRRAARGGRRRMGREPRCATLTRLQPSGGAPLPPRGRKTGHAVQHRTR